MAPTRHYRGRRNGVSHATSLGTVENLDQGQESESACRNAAQMERLDKFSNLIAGIYCSWHRPNPLGSIGFTRLPFRCRPQRIARNRTGAKEEPRPLVFCCGSFSRNYLAQNVLVLDL